MQTGSKYQDRGSGRGRGGRSGTNQRHVRTNPKPVAHNINTTDSKPKPKPRVTEQEQTHKFILMINPGIMTAKRTTLERTFKVITRTIDKKTGKTAVFHPTTKLPLPQKPIAHISDNFPISQAEQRDFFYVQEINASSVEIYLAITMSGTTQEDLHASMKNTLKPYSLWLTNKELAAQHQVWIGWIKNGNLTYTDPQGQSTGIEEEIIRMAEVNPEAAR